MLQEQKTEKSKSKNSHIMIISLLSLVIVALFMIEIYEIINDPANLTAIGTIGAFTLAAVFVESLLIGRMSMHQSKNQENALDNVYRSEKANYLLMRKNFENFDKKIDVLAKQSEIPAKELLSAQKALVKVQINRTKENTDALMISNDKMVEKINRKLDHSAYSGFNENDKAILAENNKDVLEKQQELLDGLKELENTLHNDILESANKLASMKSQQVIVREPQISMDEDLHPLSLEQDALEPNALDSQAMDFSFTEQKSEEPELEGLEPLDLDTGLLSPKSSDLESLDTPSLNFDSLDLSSTDLDSFEPISSETGSSEKDNLSSSINSSESALDQLLKGMNDQPVSQRHKTAQNTDPQLPPITLEPDISEMMAEPELPPITPEQEIPEIMPESELPPITLEQEMPEMTTEPELPPITPEQEIPEIMPESELPPITPEQANSETMSKSELPPIMAEPELSEIMPEPELPPISLEPQISETIPEPELSSPVVPASDPSEMITEPPYQELDTKSMPAEPDLDSILSELELHPTAASELDSKLSEPDLSTTPLDDTKESSINVSESELPVRTGIDSIKKKPDDNLLKDKNITNTTPVLDLSSNHIMTPDEISAMIENTVSEKNANVQSNQLEANYDEVSKLNQELDESELDDADIDQILKEMDIEDIKNDTLEDFDIDQILKQPQKLAPSEQKGAAANQVMSSDEIEALIASTNLLDEPPSGSVMPDLSNPSHVMNPDEIAALIASM